MTSNPATTAEPYCCGSPMVHNSFTEQYECADAYFALHDDGIDPYMVDADMTDLDAAQRGYLDHWTASRVEDDLRDFLTVGDRLRRVVTVELAGVTR